MGGQVDRCMIGRAIRGNLATGSRGRRSWTACAQTARTARPRPPGTQPSRVVCNALAPQHWYAYSKPCPKSAALLSNCSQPFLRSHHEGTRHQDGNLAGREGAKPLSA